MFQKTIKLLKKFFTSYIQHFYIYVTKSRKKLPFTFVSSKKKIYLDYFLVKNIFCQFSKNRNLLFLLKNSSKNFEVLT